MGGIIPPVARDLHKKHVEEIVNLSLERASISAAVGLSLLWIVSIVCKWHAYSHFVRLPKGRPCVLLMWFCFLCF